MGWRIQEGEEDLERKLLSFSILFKFYVWNALRHPNEDIQKAEAFLNLEFRRKAWAVNREKNQAGKCRIAKHF